MNGTSMKVRKTFLLLMLTESQTKNFKAMKKIIFILLCLFLVISCKKEETPTTYQIINNMTPITSAMQYLDGSIYEVVVFHYYNSDIIKQDEFSKISCNGGKTAITDIPEKSEKIKVSFKFLPPESAYYDYSSNDRKYIIAYTIVEKGKNNVITINDNTMVSVSINKLENERELLKVK